jgi:hypothetical protein
MLNEVFHERFWPAMRFPIEDLEEKLAISKQNLRMMMIHAINNKPDEITCEENPQRLLNLYYANDKD